MCLNRANLCSGFPLPVRVTNNLPHHVAAAFDAEAESLGEPGESKGAGLDQLLDAIAASGGVGMSPSSTKEAGGDAPERARKGMRWNEDKGEFVYFF